MPQAMPSHALPATQLLFKGLLDQLSPGGWPWSGQLWAETLARGLCCPANALALCPLCLPKLLLLSSWDALLDASPELLGRLCPQLQLGV